MSRKKSNQGNIQQLRKQQLRLDKAMRLSGKAKGLWMAGEKSKALRQFEKAHQTAPDHPGIHLDLAYTYLLLYELDKAERIFEFILKKHERTTSALLRVAECYKKMPRYDLAEPYYREAASRDDCSADGLLDYAETAERVHDLDEAKEAIKKAADKAACSSKLALMEARLFRRDGDKESVRRTLESLLESSRVPSEIAWKSYYELGRNYDSQKNYSKAMGAWLQAKEIQQSEIEGIAENCQTLDKELERTLTHLTPVHCQKWQQRLTDVGEPKRMALLTGHPRSGTTLLEQVIDAHTEALSADESSIFGDDMVTPIRQNSDQSLSLPEVLTVMSDREVKSYRDNYIKHTETFMSEPLGNRLLLDKNPSLTNQLPAFNAIFPETKILFALRDPRDVILSCFAQSFHMNTISYQYLTLERAAKNYAQIMDSWLRVRDKLTTPWIEIKYEDLVDDLESQARRVLDFLELPWQDGVMDYHMRSREKFVSSPTYEAVTKKVYRGAMGRWENYAEYFEPLEPILQPYLKAFGYEA